MRSAGEKGPAQGSYQISSWATRFMRSAAVVLSGFCDMAPGVSANLWSLALDSASFVLRCWETGCQVTHDA